jgi:hypothetical protein
VPTLSRYTSIPAMLDTLLNRHLVLVDPRAWKDLNDREIMEAFARSHPGSRVFAACMAEGKETAHHWQVFADRGFGACVRFDRDRLCAALDGTSVEHGPVSYVEWRDLGSTELGPRLPFLKRGVFRFEREYRVVALVPEFSVSGDALCLPIPLTCITSIYISGELPAALFETVAAMIKRIPDCAGIPVRHSGLLRNENWSASLQRLVGTSQG